MHLCHRHLACTITCHLRGCSWTAHDYHICWVCRHRDIQHRAAAVRFVGPGNWREERVSFNMLHVGRLKRAVRQRRAAPEGRCTVHCTLMLSTTIRCRIKLVANRTRTMRAHQALMMSDATASLGGVRRGRPEVDQGGQRWTRVARSAPGWVWYIMYRPVYESGHCTDQQ